MAWPSPLSLIQQLEEDFLPDYRDEDGFGLSYRAEWVIEEDGEKPTLEVTITEEIPYVFRSPELNPLASIGMVTVVPFEMECTSLSPTYRWRNFLRGRKQRRELNVTARLVEKKASQAVRMRKKLAEIRAERAERETRRIEGQRQFRAGGVP